MSFELLWTGPDRAPLTVILAHGAGAPMDTPFMAYFAEGLAAAGYRVGRFEFPYMAAQRATGRRKPPDRAPVLLDTWRGVIRDHDPKTLVIGGKSMGGRIASMVADELGVHGLLCLGYPFYGMGRRDKPRIAHMQTLRTPTLICQGERDPLGDRAAIEAIAWTAAVAFRWLPDGDHDFKPRKGSGHTPDGNLALALAAATDFLRRLE